MRIISYFCTIINLIREDEMKNDVNHMKKFIFGIIASMVVIAGGVSCQSGNAVKQEKVPMEDTDGDSLVGDSNVSGSTAVFEVSDSVEVGKERLSVLKKSDGAHGYREFYIERAEEYGCHFKVFDSRRHSTQEIVFGADDYLNDGAPGLYAFASPDKRYVYVVGDILANSTGWISTFIIYQVNTETLKAKLVNGVAAVRQEKQGFTVAEMSRCLTPDTVYSYQMEFTFRDVTYNFNGKVIKRSAEYSPIEIKKRYGKSLINIKGLGIMRGQDD